MRGRKTSSPTDVSGSEHAPRKSRRKILCDAHYNDVHGDHSIRRNFKEVLRKNARHTPATIAVLKESKYYGDLLLENRIAILP